MLVIYCTVTVFLCSILILVGNFEGKFESLDLAELAKKQPWWLTLLGQESGPSAEKYSVATQLLIEVSLDGK